MFPSQISQLFKADLFFIPSVFRQQKLSQWRNVMAAKFSFHIAIAESSQSSVCSQTLTAAKFIDYWRHHKGVSQERLKLGHGGTPFSLKKQLKEEDFFCQVTGGIEKEKSFGKA